MPISNPLPNVWFEETGSSIPDSILKINLTFSARFVAIPNRDLNRSLSVSLPGFLVILSQRNRMSPLSEMLSSHFFSGGCAYKFTGKKKRVFINIKENRHFLILDFFIN